MLEQLTKKQEQLMYKVKDERLHRFFKLPKLDKEQAGEFIDYLYWIAGLNKPTKIFLESPMALQIGANFLSSVLARDEGDTAQVRAQVWDQVKAQVRDQVRDQVWDQVWAQVQAQVRDQVRAQVRDQVWAQVRDQVWAQVRAQVRDQVRAQVRDQVRAQVRAQVRDISLTMLDFWYYGDVSCYWRNAFNDFFTRIKVIDNSKFNEYIELNKWVFLTIQLKDYCFICWNPEYVKRDEKNRLHNVEDMAVKWSDGRGLYYLHGIHFEKEVFDKFKNEELSPQEIMNWKNQDQKRAMLMEIDYPTLLKELKAEKIDSSIDGNGYEMNLYKIDLWDDENPAKFYEAIDPSKNERVVLRVHPTEVKTCMEAKLWTRKFLWDKYKEKEEIEFVKET